MANILFFDNKIKYNFLVATFNVILNDQPKVHMFGPHGGFFYIIHMCYAHKGYYFTLDMKTIVLNIGSL
jgi:hypothetical protein